MKISFVILFFSIFNSLLSQEMVIKNLLLGTDSFYEKKVLLKTNPFEKELFKSFACDSVYEYFTIGYKYVSFNESTASVQLIPFTDSMDFDTTIFRIREKIRLAYNSFEGSDDNRKYYKSFVRKGVIITTIPSKKTLLLIYVNHCFYTENKRKIVNLTKTNNYFGTSFILYCGGEVFGERIK